MSAYKRFTFNDETEGPIGPVGPVGPQGPSGNFVGKIKDWQSEKVPIQLPGQPLFHIIEDGDDIYLGLAGPGLGVGIHRNPLLIVQYDSFFQRNFETRDISSCALPMDINNGAPLETITEQQWIKVYDVADNRRGYIPIYYPEAAELQLKIGNLNILNGGLIDTTNFTAGTYNSAPGQNEPHFEFNLSNTLILENSGNFVDNSLNYTLDTGFTDTSTNLVYNTNWNIISPNDTSDNMHYDKTTHVIKLYKTGISDVVYTRFVIPYVYTLINRTVPESTEFVFYVQWT